MDNTNEVKQELLQETTGPLGHLMVLEGRTLEWADLKDELDWVPRVDNEAGDLTPDERYGAVEGLMWEEGKLKLVCERARFEVKPLNGPLRAFVYGLSLEWER